MTPRLAILIPTRNRPAFPVNAARSLADQDRDLEIYVSDNSTSGDALRDAFHDSRAQLLRPPREMAVAEHWDWAIREVLSRSASTHLVVHHDRRWSYPNAWGAIASVAARWPGSLITFGTDAITDTPPPLRLWQTPWTGKVFRIRSDKAANVIAQGRIAEAGHALPMLAQCAVPVEILRAVLDRFGDVCNSTGPDIAFMARFLALFDDYLHADRALGVLYAPERSTSMGWYRGEGGDFHDLQRLHGDRPWLDAAPLPGVHVGSNMLFHEYERVRRVTGDRLPPLDHRAYLGELGAGLRWVTDARRRESLRTLLVAAGWTGESPELPPAPRWPVRLRHRLTLLAGRAARNPPLIHGFAFRDDAEALRAAMRHRRPAQESHEHLSVFEPEELDAA